MYISMLCICSSADQFKTIQASFVEFVLFLMQKRIAVEHEKHEDGLPNKKGEAHDSLDDISCSKFQYLSLTQTILVKMTI